jgi:hypothetical protein
MIPQKGFSGDLHQNDSLPEGPKPPFWTDRFLMACFLSSEWALFVALVEAHALGLI